LRWSIAATQCGLVWLVPSVGLLTSCTPAPESELAPVDPILWLSADTGIVVSAPATSVTDSARQPFWHDQSGAGNHAFVIDRPPGAAAGPERDRRPQVVHQSGRQTLRFDGQDDLLGLADAEGLNLGDPWGERTIALAFTTSDDVDRRQMIFETGGDLRGFNIYLDAGELHMSAYDLWNDDGGRTTPFGPLDVIVPVSSGTAYAVVFELNQPTGLVRGWVNRQLRGELTGAGRVFQHHEDTGIGAINEDTYYHDGVQQGVPAADFFAGDIEKVLVYNRVLSSPELSGLWRLLE
jgi:hypothetical protein